MKISHVVLDNHYIGLVFPIRSAAGVILELGNICLNYYDSKDRWIKLIPSLVRDVNSIDVIVYLNNEDFDWDANDSRAHNLILVDEFRITSIDELYRVCEKIGLLSNCLYNIDDLLQYTS